MEQQKTLWIIFSVALFLLAVTVVGFIWFLPPGKGSGAPSTAAMTQPAATTESTTGGTSGLDPLEWVRNAKTVPEVSSAPPKNNGQLLVVGENGTSAGTEATAPASQSETAQQPAQTSKSPTTVAVAQPQATGAIHPSTTPVSIPNQAPAPRPAAPKPAAAPRPAAAPAAKPQPKPTTITQYFIQAASFTSMNRAQQTQSLLADKGLGARVFTHDENGKTYYRVRIGPYGSKSEAEKFLTWLKAINSFEGSYISQVYSTK